MLRKVNLALVLALLIPPGLALSEAPPAHGLLQHAIELHLDPTQHLLAGSDTLRLPEARSSLSFSLHASLKPRVEQPGLRLHADESAPAVASGELAGEDHPHPVAEAVAEGAKLWRLEADSPRREWIVSFAGELYQEANAVSFSREKVGSEIRSTVGEEGVYLSGGSGWYPLVDEELARHRVTTVLPRGWHSLTQGSKVMEVESGDEVRCVWDAAQPSDGINLVANRFRVDSRMHGDTAVETYFFPEDSSLATGYLDACERYLDLYESFLSPYPFAKFAVVENFFPTGYGMPSWTLLGQQVIRLPFIKDISLGHEVAHNWWGNSVFIGEGGNWCEGLTVYTADYLYKEADSPAAARQYRKDLLRDYTRYLSNAEDFALADFVSRHDPSSRAVGYGKSMMVFHMLEERVGREVFRAALRRVIAERQWDEATWSDFFRAVEAEGGLVAESLASEQCQWIDQSGAPRLELTSVQRSEDAEGWQLRFTLSQASGEESEPYTLQVPLRVKTETGLVEERVDFRGARQDFALHTEAKPLALSIDPDFHLFRWLHEDEMEATLSLILSDAEALFVLEDGLDADFAAACREFAENFVEGEPRLVAAADFDPERSEAEERTLIWLGKRPPDFRDPPPGLTVTPFFVVFQEQRFEPGQFALVYTGKRGEGRGFMAVLADDPGQLRAMTRKVPHYGKYSYLAFESGSNRLKGNWDVGAGPLHWSFATAADAGSSAP